MAPSAAVIMRPPMLLAVKPVHCPLPDGREITAVRTGVSLYTQVRSPDRATVSLVS
jgi:hypothetical protein